MAIQEPLAHEPLERRDLAAHRRLRVAELPCRTAERTLSRHGFEDGQVAPFDTQPALFDHGRDAGRDGREMLVAGRRGRGRCMHRSMRRQNVCAGSRSWWIVAATTSNKSDHESRL